MLSIIKSAALLGIDSYPVEVEVDLSNGLPAFDIVGLPDSAVKESRERVRTAIRNAGFSFPLSELLSTLLLPIQKRKGQPLIYPSHWEFFLPAIFFPQKNRGCPLTGELSLGGSVRLSTASAHAV